VVLKVLEDEFLVGFPIQPALACVGAFFSRKVVKSLRKNVAGSSASAQYFHNASIAEGGKAGGQMIRDWDFPAQEVKNEKILNTKGPLAYIANFGQETEECGVLNDTVESDRDLVIVGMGEVRE
jgi:hypothetical protein